MTLGRRHAARCFPIFAALLLWPAVSGKSQTTPGGVIEIDGNSPATPFPHFWEKMFGSGRAVLSLRDSYRQDLHAVKDITGFEYVRFHAIFHDEVGLYDEDASERPVYNFSYIDQIYDGLLKQNVRPCVELSFMPRKLATDPSKTQAFWYHPIVSPPKDWNRWGALVEALARHFVDRYGIDEVSRWYFEVWNEPNLDFWGGSPNEPTYYQLYDQAARAIKRVNGRLRIGGPATAQAAWVDRFIRHCLENGVPVDFVSTHVYGNDSSPNVFGTDEKIPRTKFVCRAVKKVHDQIVSSSDPKLPLIWTEYNASYMNEPDVTDAPFMGPWLADTIRQCDGLTEMMSYWTFSDVFEEQGVVKEPFYGGFGLIAAGGIPKAVFNDFALLHNLGNLRLHVNSDDVLATKRDDGTIEIAAWNLFLPEEKGTAKTLSLHFGNMSTRAAKIWIVDADHGSPLRAYKAMGSPKFPNREQQDALRHAARMSAPVDHPLENGRLSLTLAPHALALIELH
ncbi:MAG TPA: hypothetical protein VFO34_00400 [Candidatus Acidoferrales bacterium]|nr:hypothetical protein [Candidatus Acidoferrales bacterium]